MTHMTNKTDWRGHYHSQDVRAQCRIMLSIIVMIIITLIISFQTCERSWLPLFLVAAALDENAPESFLPMDDSDGARTMGGGTFVDPLALTSTPTNKQFKKRHRYDNIFIIIITLTEC